MLIYMSLKDIKALVLLSGGMDSTTLLYDIHKRRDGNVQTLTINYMQRHSKEIDHAIRIANVLGVNHGHVSFKGMSYNGSPLVDPNTNVPAQSDKRQAQTVVPFRNTVFLVLACIYAKQINANQILIAACGDDQENYPDCRPEFFHEFNSLLFSQNEDVRVFAPYTSLTKTEIVKKGIELGVPYDLTWTCYKGNERACGICDACVERLNAFNNNNIVDPILYESRF